MQWNRQFEVFFCFILVDHVFKIKLDADVCDTCKDTGREKETTFGSIKFLCNEVVLAYFLPETF